MLQAINSKRKSEGNDCTENISDQTFKRLNAIYFIPDDRSKWEIRILQGAKEQGKIHFSVVSAFFIGRCLTNAFFKTFLRCFHCENTARS